MFDKPSNFIVQPFHFCIADMAERPETDNPVKFIHNRPGLGFLFQNIGFSGEFAPT